MGLRDRLSVRKIIRNIRWFNVTIFPHYLCTSISPLPVHLHPLEFKEEALLDANERQHIERILATSVIKSCGCTFPFNLRSRMLMLIYLCDALFFFFFFSP